MTANGSGAPPRATESPRDDSAAVKAALRTKALAARAALRDEDRREADARRLPRALDACAGHAVVACYASAGAEPDTWRLIEALDAGGVRVLLPMLRRSPAPSWGVYQGRERLAVGRFGILEPDAPALPAEALAEATFVWVPALLASLDGVRLGRGGGWYDRALLHRAADAVVGVLLWDAEIVPALPREPWDVDVDLLVSEARTLPCNRRPVAE